MKCKIVSTLLSSTKTKNSDAHCLLLHRMSSCETFIGLQELKGGAFVDTFQPFQIGKSLVDHCNKGLSEREEIQYLKSSTYKIVNSPMVVVLHPFKSKVVCCMYLLESFWNSIYSRAIMLFHVRYYILHAK